MFSNFSRVVTDDDDNNELIFADVDRGDFEDIDKVTKATKTTTKTTKTIKTATKKRLKDDVTPITLLLTVLLC